MAITAAALITGDAYAFDSVSVASMYESQADAQEQGRRPEANLPFLFAVFFITWAAFFGYIFVMSRRQREMQREIEALTRALADRVRQNVESESYPSAQSSSQLSTN